MTEGRRAADHLIAVNPAFGPVIERVGVIELERRPLDFHAVASSIVSQQLSTAAAATIFGRLLAGVGSERLTPADLRGWSPESLKRFGLSTNKARSLLHLADRHVPWEALPGMSDDDVIATLLPFRGVGVWTAQMLLMFCLARPDVFAPGDLALRHGIRVLDGLEESPGAKAAEERAAVWSPYRTYASRYLWRIRDVPV